MKDGVKALYIALFATSFATVRSSYNTGAAAFPTEGPQIGRAASGSQQQTKRQLYRFTDIGFISQGTHPSGYFISPFQRSAIWGLRPSKGHLFGCFAPQRLFLLQA